MLNKLAVRQLCYLTLAASMGLLAVVLGLSILNNRAEQDVGAKQELRYKSYLLADELRQSSDDLTRLARTYVTTGEAR
jgi:methyl-accepting chemotaxis protein